MNKQTLGKRLKQQWWLYTVIISLFYTLGIFFLLFVFEDKFYEDQLSHIAQIIERNDNLQYLPPHIERHQLQQLPLDWQQQLQQVDFNQPIEINNAKGIPIHLIKFHSKHNTESLVLALDTSKTQSVWNISNQLLILILPWALLFLILATILASRFSRQIQQHFAQLLHILKQDESPQALQQYAKQQTIVELAQFAELFAQTWQHKLDVIAQEKQSLEYLSHELRTPIQSSQATLELLALQTGDEKQIARLSRSLNRMTRLSNTILQLMGPDHSTLPYSVAIHPICQQLIDELQPLAAVKQQTFELTTSDDVTDAIATKEVIETIISILLTNAITHGDQQAITIAIAQNQLNIINSSSEQTNTQGFGIGLTIAQRLAQKFDLTVDICQQDTKHIRATLSW